MLALDQNPNRRQCCPPHRTLNFLQSFVKCYVKAMGSSIQKILPAGLVSSARDQCTAYLILTNSSDLRQFLGNWTMGNWTANAQKHRNNRFSDGVVGWSVALNIFAHYPALSNQTVAAKKWVCASRGQIAIQLTMEPLEQGLEELSLVQGFMQVKTGENTDALTVFR